MFWPDGMHMTVIGNKQITNAMSLTLWPACTDTLPDPAQNPQLVADREEAIRAHAEQQAEREAKEQEAAERDAIHDAERRAIREAQEAERKKTFDEHHKKFDKPMYWR